jgi:uncharacterized protein YbjT (DUF2867 family)
MKKRILVLGATGMLGKPVARHLNDAGFQVRILARDAAKARKLFDEAFEIEPGDVNDLASLDRAMADCYGVHISVGGAVDQISADNVAALAPKLGLAHITYVSGSTVCEENGWFPMTAQKLKAETAVIQSEIPYTIFCPTWPMEQLPRFVNNGQATLIGEKPIAWRWFATDDLGRMVANAYQREAALGKRLYVHGPEPFTMKAALTRYCETFHPEINSIDITPIDMARSVADSTGNQMLKFFAELMAYFEKVGEPGDPTEANQILGAPTTTLADWIGQRNEQMATAAAAL